MDQHPESEVESEADRDRRRRRRATGVLAVGTSAAAWWPAFTVGAWGTVFFEQLLSLWAVSTAAFVVLVIAGSERPVSRWKLAALLVPSAWLAAGLIAPTGEDTALGNVVQVAGTVITIVGIPAMAALLLRVASPSVSDVSARRDKFAAAVAVLVVIVIAFCAGNWNNRILTCEQFTISGNSEPPGCTKAQP